MKLIDRLKQSVTEAARYLGGSLSDSARKALTEGVCPLLSESLEEISGVLRDHANTGDAFVIHYTSFGVLTSMLDRLVGQSPVSLRAYDSVHVNDPNEGNYLTRFVLEDHAWLLRNEMRHAHVTSFVAHSDSKDMADNLVFWREYGRDGEGCSLCVPVGRGQTSGIPSTSLWHVRYGDQRAKASASQINQVLRELQPLFSIGDRETIQHTQRILASVVWTFLDGVRYLYKSDAYDYEKELRFVLTPQNSARKDVSFEYDSQATQPPRIRHYVEHEDLELKKNLLITGSVITLGPSLHYPENLRYYLQETLQRANMLGPEIRISRIPYRRC